MTKTATSDLAIYGWICSISNDTFPNKAYAAGLYANPQQIGDQGFLVVNCWVN